MESGMKLRLAWKEPLVNSRHSWLQPLAAGTGIGIFLALVATATSPWMAIAASVCLVLISAAFVSPSFAFLMVAAVVPIERIGRFTEDTAVHTISVMRIAGLIAFASLIVHILIKKRQFHFGVTFFAYLGYVTCAMVSIFYAPDLVQAMRFFGMMLGNLLFLFLVVNSIRSMRLARRAILLWLLTSVLAGIYTAYDWYFGMAVDPENIGISETRSSTVYIDISEYSELNIVKRAMGPTSMPGGYGINLILTIPFFFYFLRRQQTFFKRTATWIGFAVILYNILLANTRATLLVALCAVILCALFKLYRVRLKHIIMATILAIAIVPLLPQALFTRIFAPSNYTLTHSRTLSVRFWFWKGAVQAAFKGNHWLGGTGIGDVSAIGRATPGIDEEHMATHNEFLATFVELGLIGWSFFIGFLAAVIWTIRRTIRRCKALRDSGEAYWLLVSSLVATLCVLLYGVQVDVFHIPLKGWWLAAGMSVALAHMTDWQLSGASEHELSKSPVPGQTNA
jgi:hypothetical protein